MAYIIAETARRCGVDVREGEHVITYAALQRVAHTIGLDDHLPPCILARQTTERYLIRTQEEFRRWWANGSDEQRQTFDLAMDRQLGALTERERAALQAGLKIDSVTSATVRGIVLHAGTAAGPAIVVQAAGFGAYIALSTIVHAICTTVLSIIVPFGAYTLLSPALAAVSGPLAPALIAAGMARAWTETGNKLNTRILELTVGLGLAARLEDLAPVPPDQLWLSDPARLSAFRRGAEDLARERDEIERAAKEAKAIQRQIDGAQAEIEAATRRSAEVLQAAQQAAQRVAQAQAARVTAQDEIRRIGPAPSAATPDQIAAEARRRTELAARDAEVAAAVALAAETERQRIQQHQTDQRQIASLEQELVARQTDLARVAANLAAAEERCERITGRRDRELRDRYARTMPNLALSDAAFAWLARQSDHTLVNAAEAAMLDLNYNTKSLRGRGKITDTEYAHASFGPLDAYRIYYAAPYPVRVGIIGHKHDQKKDIRWLQSHPPE